MDFHTSFTPPLSTADHGARIKIDLPEAVTAVNAANLFGYDSELTFAVDRERHRIIVRLVNKKTGDLIREIPARAVLKMSHNLGR